MKKTFLSIVLCVAMIVSALSTGLVFAATETPASLYETQLLYPEGVGASDGTWQYSAQESLAQSFTVSGGNFVGLRINSLKTNRPAVGEVSIYKWNTDYATSVAGSPVYQDKFFLAGTHSMHTGWVDAEDVTIRFDRAFAPGKYVAVVKTVSGEVWLMVHGGMEGVTAYVAGTAKDDWTYKLSALVSPDAEQNETVNVSNKNFVNLYDPANGGTIGANGILCGTAGGNVMGTRFTVSEGALAGFCFVGLVNTGVATGTLKVYKWDTDYATTTAATPVVQDTIIRTNTDVSGTYDSWTTDEYVLFDHPIPADEYLLTFASAGVMYCWVHGPVAGVTSFENGTEYDTGTLKIQAIVDSITTNASDLKISHEKSFVDLHGTSGDTATENPLASVSVLTQGDVGPRFTADSSVSGIVIKGGGFGAPIRVRAYAWDTDYATTVAARPLVDCLSDPLYVSGTWNYVPFDTSLPAGEYLVLLSMTTADAWFWVASPVTGVQTYIAGQEYATGTVVMAYVKDIDTSEKPQPEPELPQKTTVPAYGDGADTSGRADFWTQVATVATKYDITEGKFVGFVIHAARFDSATTTDPVKASIYKWNKDYATTVASQAILSLDLDGSNHVNGEDFVVDLAPYALAEGEYLIVLEGGAMAIWAHNVKEGVSTFIENGTPYTTGTLKMSYIADPSVAVNEPEVDNVETADSFAWLTSMVVLTLLAASVVLTKKYIAD